LELIHWNFTQIATSRRVPHLLTEIAGKLIDVILDKSHQLDCQHGIPPDRTKPP
jgi:hypothetical protein